MIPLVRILRDRMPYEPQPATLVLSMRVGAKVVAIARPFDPARRALERPLVAELWRRLMIDAGRVALEILGGPPVVGARNRAERVLAGVFDGDAIGSSQIKYALARDVLHLLGAGPL